MLKLFKLGMMTAALVLALVLAAYSAVAVLTGEAPHLRSESSRVCSAPESLDFDGFGYEVNLTERRFPVSFEGALPTATVGRGPDHGVVVTLQAGTGSGDVSCSWDAEGVRISEGDGISHWVPAAAFTGGR